MNETLITRLTEALTKAAIGNSHASIPAFAVLWTDKERHWESVFPRLQAALPQLFALGAYSPAQRTGPAIWLKCAIAGTVGELPSETVPLIYLPGISRADLRAIETCPRDLQPLAELQYRGAFFSQANSKDWTVNAFLTSRNGGLELNVAQDSDTQDSLLTPAILDRLLDCSIEQLQGRSIDAAWLKSLVMPNHNRDVLVWLNDPERAQAEWGLDGWKIFQSRCKKELGFDPEIDGVITAAEYLASRKESWVAVWELYWDSIGSFPRIVERLAAVKPPASKGFFDDANALSGYPQVNEEHESTLRYRLNACAAMDAVQARAAILVAEQENANRRDWLWARIGRAPLARALQHLSKVADLSAKVPAGATLEKMADSYQDDGWQVDMAALDALASVDAKVDKDAVCVALRALYVPWLEQTAFRFQDLVKEKGGLGSRPTQLSAVADGVCTVFVDGLRYDVAMRLKELLGALGKVQMAVDWTSMPSVTASGKAWASPVAALISGTASDQDFQPCVASDGKPLSTYNFRKLLTECDFQVLDKHETGHPEGKAWTECGDLDHYGHEHGLRLARDMGGQLRQIVERLSELKDAGWRKFRIVTDHGWLLVPGKLPKSELLKSETRTRWGRCAVLKDSSQGTPLTFGWDWCKEVQIAFAPGIANFVSGEEYAHGGLTLQECLVPILDVYAEGASTPDVSVAIQSVTWKGLRCVVEIVPNQPGLTADIRTKTALASSSLVASVKAFENGKVSLAVEDDEQIGCAALVVVLDATGAVLQKVSTTVGG